MGEGGTCPWVLWGRRKDQPRTDTDGWWVQEPSTPSRRKPNRKGERNGAGRCVGRTRGPIRWKIFRTVVGATGDASRPGAWMHHGCPSGTQRPTRFLPWTRWWTPAIPPSLWNDSTTRSSMSLLRWWFLSYPTWFRNRPFEPGRIPLEREREPTALASDPTIPVLPVRTRNRPGSVRVRSGS